MARIDRIQIRVPDRVPVDEFERVMFGPTIEVVSESVWPFWPTPTSDQARTLRAISHARPLGASFIGIVMIPPPDGSDDVWWGVPWDENDLPAQRRIQSPPRRYVASRRRPWAFREHR